MGVRGNVAAAIILWVIVYIWSPRMNMNAALCVLENPPNLQSLRGGGDRRERILHFFWSMTAIQMTYFNLQRNGFAWNRVTSGTHLHLPSARINTREAKEEELKRRGRCTAKQCEVERYRWLASWRGAFSGSFQSNFLHLSTGTRPVRGQNEAWSLVVDGDREAKQREHGGRKETWWDSGKDTAAPWHHERETAC